MSDPRLHVVPYNPGRTFRRALGLILLVVSVGALAYFYGVFEERSRLGNPASTITRLEAEVLRLQQENSQLSQQSVIASKGAEVDRLANENVRKNIMDLRDHIAGLEEANSFYRSLMSPQDVTKGIHIGSVEIAPGRKANEYKLEVVVQQIAKTHRLVKGKLQVTVDGLEQGKVVSYAVNELSPGLASGDVKLRFKYFQTFTASLAMPQSFTPNQINISVKTSGKKPVSVNKSLSWLVGDSSTRLSSR